jgi:2-polyprenyl-6-methoxyphenol hydroxylase-like FAD-dependent oxidoreductase
LAAHEFPSPASVEVKIGVGYASRFLRRRPDDLPEGVGLYVMATPPGEKRIGVALPVDGDRWLVGLGGWHGDGPAGDPDEFVRFARSLPYPGIADLLERAEPVTDVEVQQFPSSRRRYFERLRRVPRGLVTVGDAIASFNPIYGQGMTAALLQARTLGQVIDRHGHESTAMPQRFYRAAARIASTPWRFATGADYLYPETTGPRPAGTDLLNRYSIRIQRAAMTSTEVRRTFVAVQHLLAPSSRLLRPAMVVKVLRASRAAKRP